MKRVRSLLFTFVILLNALAGLAVLIPQTAEAAQAKNDITIWRSSDGIENNVKTTNWTGRFSFVDPYTIKDNTVGTLYQTTNEITKKNEDYTFLWNGNGNHFYYRPVDAAGGNYLDRNTNNKCVGIIVVWLNDDSTDMNIKLVQPLDSPSGGDCIVAEASDVEGSGNSPDKAQHYILDVPEDISGESLEKLIAPYQWKNSDTLISYRTNTILLRPTDEALKGIQESWQSLGRSLSIPPNRPYQFFTTDECFNGTKVTAYLAVSPGDPNYATMVKEDIFGSGYSISTNNTEVPKCLYPDTGIKRSPNGSEDMVDYKGDMIILAHRERQGVTPGSSEDTDPTLPPGSLDDSTTVAGDCYSGLRNSLAWILCPILGIIDNFIEWAERAISNQLTVDLGTQATRDSLQDAWRVVARFASGILVVIALVMVISTALGSDLVSPYALKKILPRLVIGAIGIWLSWALVSTYIDIMNDLGKGIAGIMLTPFQEAKEFSLQNMAGIASGSPGGGGTSGTIFVGLATAGLLGGNIFGLLGVGLTALFAFLVAIFVLALRQAVIVFLVVLAPLGFAMWILPNTQKLWKLWSGTLNKLLIMYPMIMGLLAAGKIFAYITSQSAAGEESTIDHFLAFSIALIAYVAPYFFLPALFKAAGGVFSNLTGMVNNKGKGIFDKSRGWLDKKKALSNRELAKKQRDTIRTQGRTQDFAAGLAGGRLSSYRRFRAGGFSGKSRSALFSTASATARSTADKELESTVGGDSDVLKVIASGGANAYRVKERAIKGASYDSVKTEQIISRAESLAKSHLGDRNSQAAALQRLAGSGQAGSEHFEAVAEAFKDDPTNANVIIGAAASASGKAGNLSAGTLQYDPVTKKVGHKIVDDPAAPGGKRQLTPREAVYEKLATMSGADFANIKTKYNPLTKKAEFTDEEVEKLLTTDIVLAKKLFEDKNAQLSGNARDILQISHAGGAWKDPRVP